MPESDEINTESMQHVISYLHEDLSLPIYNKTAELSFEDVFCILTSNVKSQMICIRTPFDIKETSSFIVDLTKLDNIKDVTGNDGEKMEHHGQPLRQIVLKGDKITVRKRFSKIDSLSQEADEIFYMYLYLSKTICKKFKRKIFYGYKDQEKKLHTDMLSLISKLTVIMFVLVSLMETQKHSKNVSSNLRKYNSKIERSHSWYEA